MGGAAACICAMMLHKDGFSVDSLHVFGIPRFTNPAGAEKFGHVFGDRLLRVCHYNDVIRNLPPISHGYKHVGRVVIMHDDDTVWYFDKSPLVEPVQNISHTVGFEVHRTSHHAKCVQRQIALLLGMRAGERHGYHNESKYP